MRGHHKRGTARFGCLRRFCLSTHSESFGVIRWPECDCVCAGVGLSGGRGRLLTHVHRASACTLNAVGLLPVSGCGDARVAPPCPTTLCVWRNLPYLTLDCRRPFAACRAECENENQRSPMCERHTACVSNDVNTRDPAKRAHTTACTATERGCERGSRHTR